MAYYINSAQKIELYMTVMRSLGYEDWTVTIDENVWPLWICATHVMKSVKLCAEVDDADCMGECDEWSRRSLSAMHRVKEGDALSLWRARASQAVASRWLHLSR
jgi:hypothetical protein